MTPRQVVAAAYDRGVEDEYHRLVRTPISEFEFKLITELIETHTPARGVIVDIGAGPGRYAEHLIRREFPVGVVDLSARSLRAFSDRIGPRQDHVLFNRVSCATDLHWIADRSADTILLMGPMYHLPSQREQKKALDHCYRILRSGGTLITVFMSPFGALVRRPGCRHCAAFKRCASPEQTQSCTTLVDYQGHAVPQFRCSPTEACILLTTAGFSQMSMCNIEGFSLYLNCTDIERYDQTQLFAFLKRTGSHPDLIGRTEQFVTVSRRI